MAPKSRFVGVRLEPEDQRELILLSLPAGEPGNMSAGLRLAIRVLKQMRVSGSLPAEIAQAEQQQSEAVAHG